MLSKIQYISQGTTAEEQLKNIQAALEAGVVWIQFRMKEVDDILFETTAIQAQAMCKRYQAIFIINDRVSIAQKIDADGVHVGLNDLAIKEVRKILRPNSIIGGTANTLADVEQRIQEKCDYIGLGPFRFTKTKQNLSPIVGLSGYQKIIDSISDRSIPIYAIGGIEVKDVSSIILTGIHGIALSGLITHAPNKKELITQLNELI